MALILPATTVNWMLSVADCPWLSSFCALHVQLLSPSMSALTDRFACDVTVTSSSSSRDQRISGAGNPQAEHVMTSPTEYWSWREEIVTSYAAAAQPHTHLGQLSLASLLGRLIEYQLRLG